LSSRKTSTRAEKAVEYNEQALTLFRALIQGDRWSLAALDKTIARREEDSKLVPQRAPRLDLRSLGRINYSTV
jgi:hypothetical protein